MNLRVNKIKCLLKLLLKNQSGATLVIVAAAMVALLGFTAFVVDVGYIYLQRRNMQNAADAGALAAAFELPDGQITKVARDYTRLHGVEHGFDNTTVDVFHPNEDRRKVQVLISKNVVPFFSQALGIHSFPVKTSAIATGEAPFLDILPFFILDYRQIEDQFESLFDGPGSVVQLDLSDERPPGAAGVLVDFKNNAAEPGDPFDPMIDIHNHDDYIDYLQCNWSGDKQHFYYIMKLLLQEYESGSLNEPLWFKADDVSGNWGTVDLSDFIEGSSGGADALRKIIADGLDESICNAQIGVNEISPETGKKQSIDDELQLRLERSKTAWVIMPLKDIVDLISGTGIPGRNPNHLEKDEYIFAKVENLSYNPGKGQDGRLDGEIVAVEKDCSGLKASMSLNVNVYLIR